MQKTLEPALESLSPAPDLRESLAAGILAVDAQPQLCSLNPLARKLIGLSETHALPAPLTLLPAPLAGLIQETLTTLQPVSNRELSFLDQTNRTAHLLVSTLPSTTGGLVVTLQDLNQARQLEQKMSQLNRLASVGTLSASMAHEIKNALVAVKTFVELLLKHNQDSELAEVVSREMTRIDSIVSQMLRFAGPAKPTFSPVSLHQIIAHSLQLVQHQLEGRKIRLIESFQADPDHTSGDGYQLEQALVNLLLNAIEAMPPNGELTVATDILAPAPNAPVGLDRAQLRVRIQDKGIGIPAENLGKLFEPFFTTKIEGTGLGLPITRRIVRDHRGSITVESQPQQGTTFNLLFPLLTS